MEVKFVGKGRWDMSDLADWSASDHRGGSRRRRALVTGASSGIGLAVARALRDEGYDVIGTSRSGGRIDGIPLMSLDLADPDSVRALVREIDDVHVLVCNAGESVCGPFEDVGIDAFERLLRVNVTGHVQLLQGLLPAMRRRREGRIVMIGSLHATLPVAFRSAYVASKAALRGVADALRSELRPHGIGVMTVEPGSVRTGISERRGIHLSENSVHAEVFDRFLTRLDDRERRGIAPDEVARVVLVAVAADRPRRLYAAAPRGRLTLLVARVLPGALVERLVDRAHAL